jgi:hypothetical protein
MVRRRSNEVGRDIRLRNGNETTVNPSRAYALTSIQLTIWRQPETEKTIEALVNLFFFNGI